MVAETVDPDDPNHAGTELDLTTTYDYDAASRRIATTDPTGTKTTYVYDTASRLITVTVDPDDPNVAGTELDLDTHYTYDAAGNVTSVTDPTGLVTWYEYDELNRLVEVTTAGSPQPVTTYQYDPAGRRTRITLPSGQITTFDYDERGLLTEQVVDFGTSPHLNLTTTYAYDDAGRQTVVTNPRGYETEFGYTTTPTT